MSTDRNYLFELYALGLSDPEERQAIEAELVSGDPEVRKLLAGAIQRQARLAYIAPAAAPASALRRRVLASAGAESSGISWLGALALVAASLFATVLYFNTRLGQQQEIVARDESALRLLRLPETRVLTTTTEEVRKPIARVFVHPTQGVVLTAVNLPAIGPGKVFEMWFVPKTGNPIPSGTFKADAQGNAIHVSPGAVNIGSTAAVALSVEPEGGSPQPTTTPFLAAST